MSINETLNKAKNTIASLPPGTLLYFSDDTYYAKSKNNRDSAITSSKTMSWTNNNVYRISNAFTYIHKCTIIWNNKEHIALIYYEKNYPKRFYLKIRTGFINGNPYFSNHLPILHYILP